MGEGGKLLLKHFLGGLKRDAKKQRGGQFACRTSASNYSRERQWKKIACRSSAPHRHSPAYAPLIAAGMHLSTNVFNTFSRYIPCIRCGIFKKGNVKNSMPNGQIWGTLFEAPLNGAEIATFEAQNARHSARYLRRGQKLNFGAHFWGKIGHFCRVCGLFLKRGRNALF